jgi:ribonucleoside-diphosphate reductase alpha chain
MTKYSWLNQKSREFLSRGYVREGQTAEERIKEIAMTAEKYLNISGFAEKFEDYMSRGWFSLSSPVWANYGLDRGLPVSCNGSYVDDTMNSILTKTAEIGFMTKLGAGTSAYFGDLRPRGAKISTGGESSGPVHFMELFDKTIKVISQSNIRRGSMAAYLPVEHPDIMEFLKLRSEGNAIQDLSIGVCISNEWMNGLLNKDKDKLKIWGAIIKKRFESGYPYIFFSDNANNAAPLVYKNKGKRIHASNLCVSPETMLLTKDGYFPISLLENDNVEVWNGKQWSKTTVIKTGENKKLVKVILSNGQTLECTPYHKWYIVKNYNDQRNNKLTEKRTHELVIGDKLCKFNLPIIDGTEEFLSPYTHGLYCADGCLENINSKRISLYGEKKNLAQFLDIKTDRDEDATGRRNIVVNPFIADKFTVPINSSLSTKLRWLEGYFDGDGTIAINGTNESIQAVSIEFEFLKQIQLLLQTIGIDSKITHMADAEDRLMPDGKGGYKLYPCKESKRLLINSNGLYKLSQLGFSPNRLKFTNRLPQRDATQFVTIMDIVDEGRIDDTYCVNEPLEHKVIFNGILTGNCSEIMLSSDNDESFVCVLSSMNLLHYDEWKDTDAVEVLTYFLDTVTTEYINKTVKIPYMDAAHNFAKRQRAVGLGVLGWHSLLQSKMIPFESMQAKFLNSEIFQLLNEKTLLASKELANLYGEPELMIGTGERMATRMAVAPTKSSSFILGQVSEGIEPIDSNYFVKKLAKGSFTYKNPYLKKLLIKKEKDTDDVWKSILENGGSVQHLKFLDDVEKDVFKTFGEISQKEVVIQAAQRQKYIDQAQSLNIIIHPKTPPKDVSQLLIFGWENGIKTFYYQKGVNPALALSRSINECKSCEA